VGGVLDERAASRLSHQLRDLGSIVSFTSAVPNDFSERVARSSVCLSSVTLVHFTQAVVIFGNFSTAFGTLAIH